MKDGLGISDGSPESLGWGGPIFEDGCREGEMNLLSTAVALLLLLGAHAAKRRSCCVH